MWTGSVWLATAEYQPRSRDTGMSEALAARRRRRHRPRPRIYTGKPARLLKTKWTEAWAEEGAPEPLPMPLQNLLVAEAHSRMSASGDPDVISMPVGQIVGRMNEVRPVAEVMADLVRETNQALDRLRNLG